MKYKTYMNEITFIKIHSDETKEIFWIKISKIFNMSNHAYSMILILISGFHKSREFPK